MSKKSFNSLSGLNNLKKEISKSENDDLINELKELWKITEASLIGKVIRKKEGFFLFDNIETTNGERVKYPNNEDVVLRIPKNLEVKSERKYKFSFNISPSKSRTQRKQPHLIMVDHLKSVKVLEDNFYSNEGRSFILSNFKRKEKGYLEYPENATDQVNSLDIILHEINKKPETFIFELIQNADDYPDPLKDSTKVKFSITSNHIVLTHNGSKFTESNVKAISAIGSNDKKDQEDKIGYKGMGFKSIYKFSNHVWIKSGKFSFKFDENYYTRKTLKDGKQNPKYSSYRMPWQILPIWTSPRVEDLEEKEQKLIKNPVCIFIRPNANKFEREEKLLDIEKMFVQTFKHEDRILLFLRNVKELEFQGKESNFITTLDKRVWSVSKLKQLEIPNEIRKELIIESKKPGSNIPEKYGMMSSTEITFATKKDNTEIQKTDDAKIFAFLPTDWNLGFDFLINGNFIADGSREELFHDIEWNLYLMKESGRLFVKWIASMVIQLENPSPYKILPDINSIISDEKDDKKLVFLNRFKIGMQNGILETPFVLDVNNRLCLLNDIIIDKTGFAEVLGETIFKQVFNIDKNILQKEIKNKSWFDNQFSGTQVEIFDWDTLKENSTELTSILKDPISNVKFIDFLISSDKMYDFKDIAFVLTKTGELEKPSNVYINITDDDLSLVSKLDVHQMNAEVKSGIIGEYQKHFKKYYGYKFIQDEIISKTDSVNGILETVEESKELFNHLLKYSNQFNSSNLNQLGNLKIYTVKEENVKINEGDLYIYHHTLQNLIEENCFPTDHFQIVSNKYSLEIHEFLKSLHVMMYLPVEFIKHEICQYVDKINEHLIHLDDDIKLKATQHLFELIITHKSDFSQDVSKNIFNTCKELKVLTKDNEFTSVSACFLSSEYTGNTEIENLMEDFPEKSISFISPSYLNSRIDKKDWKQTFQKLKCSDDHFSFIKKELLPSLHVLNENQIINVTKLIFKDYKKLGSELSKLTFFPVLTKSGIVDMYNQSVFLGKEYNQDLDNDIENLMENCLFNKTISNQYTSDKYEEWKKFWIFAIGRFSEYYVHNPEGTKNDIIEEGFQYLNENDETIDIDFDSILNWMKTHNNLSESHLQTYMQKNLVTPNINNKLCYSNELFVYNLKDILDDNDRVCSIDLSEFPNVQESLGLMTEIDIDIYIKILNRQKSITWLNDNKIIDRLDTLLTEENKSFPESFIDTGMVMNQKKDWVLISDIYSIEDDFSKNLGIKTSKYIIHKDFNKLSSKLEIKELTRDDFEFNPIGAEKTTQLKNILLDRMQYLSFYIQGNDIELRKELEKHLKEKINNITFYKCSGISYKFEDLQKNIEIKKSDYKFYVEEEEDEVILYYIGDWEKFRAAEMIEWIFSYLDLSEEGIKRAYETILSLRNHGEIVEYLKENGFNIPITATPAAEEVKFEEETKEEVEETHVAEKVKVEEAVVAEETPAAAEEGMVASVEETETEEEIYKVNFSDSEIKYLESVITGDIDFSSSAQKDINKNAVFRSILFLRDEGYSISENTLESFLGNNEKQFKHENGEIMNFIIRSAAKGVLFLDPSSWEKLEKADVSLLIYEGHETITWKNNRESLIEDYTDFNKFGLVRVGNDFDFCVNDFDNLLFQRDDDFENEKYDKYKLLFLLKENEQAKEFINIFSNIGGENDSK